MPTSFADMRTAVQAITNRPELVSITDMAIRLATLRAHGIDFFPRDRASMVLSYTPVASSPFTEIAGVYTTDPLLRTPEFMQSEELVTYAATENLAYIPSVQDFWDEDNILKYSVFTQIGDTLRCSFASATGRARLWYYRNPDVSVSSYSSWIADLHKDELAMWAAGIVWQRTGLQEQAAGAQQTVLGIKDLLITSYLTSKK
jgi:hypothetical protein